MAPVSVCVYNHYDVYWCIFDSVLMISRVQSLIRIFLVDLLKMYSFHFHRWANGMYIHPCVLINTTVGEECNTLVWKPNENPVLLTSSLHITCKTCFILHISATHRSSSQRNSFWTVLICSTKERITHYNLSIIKTRLACYKKKQTCDLQAVLS